MKTGRERDTDKGILHEFLDWVGLLGFIYGPLDRRLAVGEALGQAMKRPVPRVSWWGCFGGISLFLFLIQVATGITLMFFYVPTEPGAFASIRYLSGDAPYGWLIRTTHHWAGNGLLVALFIHVVRVFVTGAYQRPRDLNWVIGCSLFLFVFAFILTGHLLPWSQSAYWTAVYWTGLVGRLPLVGPWAMVLIRGGDQITGTTLTRFYALHVAVLPILSALFMAMHFVIIRKLGISEPL